MSASTEGSAEQAVGQRIADLERLLEVAKRLGATSELDPLLETIASAATAVLDCERASVFLLDNASGELCSRVATGMAASPIKEIRFPVGVGIAGEVARGGISINIADAYADARFNAEFDRRSGFRTRSMLAVPLADHEGTVVGVLQLLNKRGTTFGPRDEELAGVLGSQAGVAVQRQLLLAHYADKRRIERDLSIAREIQQRLLPTEAPSLQGFDVAGWNRPADQTGGDYFDFFTLPDASVTFTIADATGHGIGPALVVSEARALYRALVSPDADLAQLVARINDLLCADLPEGRFVTALFGIVSPDEDTVRFISAGQGPILVFRTKNDSVEEFDSHGLPLGVMPGVEYERETMLRLNIGDMLVLLTDGFYEWQREDGTAVGNETICNLLRRHRDLPAAALIQALRADVEAFVGGSPQTDDLTAVVVKRTS